MRYLKTVLSLIVVLLLATNLFGLYSDDFIIGAYSYMSGGTDEIYFDYLSEANFNSHVCNISSEDITDLFTKSDSRGLDIILSDFYWHPENSVVGVYNLTRANNYYYEAEYSEIGQPPLIPVDCASEFHYRITREVGDQIEDIENQASHQNVWVCYQNSPDYDEGLAVDTLYWKWQYNNNNYLLEKQIILSKQDTLLFDFAMRLDPLGHSNSTPICDVNVFVVNDDGEKVNLPIHPYIEILDDNILTVEEFDNAPYSQYPPGSNYKLFTFYTMVDSISDSLIYRPGSSEPKLYNISFEVYWHGNGNLYIDYFKIYDDIYKKLENGEYDDMLANRLSEIDVPNLKYFYSKDEPVPPLFDAYRLVEDIIDDLDYSKKLITAVNMYQRLGTYNHHRLFNYKAEPEILMFNNYPCDPYTIWNCNPDETDKHIQDNISRMLNWYRETLDIADSSGIPFLVIPQSYGRWVNVGTEFEKWGWKMRPTKEMQKCLQYLPLCYDVTGIVDYKFISEYNNHSSKCGDYSEPIDRSVDSMIEQDDRDYYFHRLALIDKDDTTNTGNPVLTSQYFAVQEANDKIAVYGPIIDSLRWLGANYDNNVVNEGTVYETGLTSVEVLEDTSTYNGYIEIGAYKDDDTGKSYFMLANRRTNFPKQYYTNPDYTLYDVPMNVDTAFVVADSQEVTFYFSDLIPWLEYAFIDMYTEESVISQVSETGELEVSITIGPGDGKLIQMAIHPPIPYIVESSFVVPANKHCIIDYPITVEEGGALILSDGVILHFWENGSIEVYGEIEIGDSVKFTAPEGESWDGLYLYNTEAEVTMDNVTFERCKLYNESLFLNITSSDFTNSGIEQSGDVLELYYTNFDNSALTCNWKPNKSDPPVPAYIEVDVNNCYFESCSDYAVSITNYPLYELQNNVITNCEGGFDISNSGNPKKCIISDNHIYDNSGYGIFIYNSYAEICDHSTDWGQNVIENNSRGIVGINNSSITIIGNPDYPHSTIQDNEAQELYFDPSSFPEKICYNKIIDDSYINGSVDQYLIFCRNYTGGERKLIVEDNYWGPESEDWIEWTGDSRFLPNDAYDYIPVWIPGPPVNPLKGTGAKGLYADADSLIQIEEYEQAKQVYRDIIELYPESKFAIFSMRNLLPLETISGQNFASLQEYYQTDPNCNYNPERTKLSEYLANWCNIKMENYPDAISFFEDIIEYPDTEMDSVYAVIDAGYTYLLMGDGGGKSTYIGRMPELKPKSVVEFEEMRE